MLAEGLIAEGTHTYTWIYQKDFMSYDGNDCVWIDNITFPCSSFTDVNEMNDDDIRIYPNPANDFINIEIENNYCFTNLKDMFSLEISLLVGGVEKERVSLEMPSRDTDNNHI